MTHDACAVGLDWPATKLGAAIKQSSSSSSATGRCWSRENNTKAGRELRTSGSCLEGCSPHGAQGRPPGGCVRVVRAARQYTGAVRAHTCKACGARMSGFVLRPRCGGGNCTTRTRRGGDSGRPPPSRHGADTRCRGRVPRRGLQCAVQARKSRVLTLVSVPATFAWMEVALTAGSSDDSGVHVWCVAIAVR